ncbi:uncharacterized protein LOC106159305 [Lingula anatina]|uniref:RNA helicase n=1 Tax=Lingula anatina TaxID=7574 RepID=A0A2R2MMK8_LINAN|nr:uncharacterized protein LOC106159305 [Lingula anatina]|eukprot:XP_023931429.1 uncharacterized protein LOC106159305 [Lingula anatina]
MAKEIHITLLKVEDLHHVWYREAASISCSEEVKKYHEMMEKLNELMDDDQAITHKVHHPAIGQFYAGRDVKERRWFRVKIKNLMLATKNGPTASCFRVDFADTVMIQFSNLRILPEEYGIKNIPKQAKEMAFYGLQPLTLVTDLIEMNTTPKPCFKWSVSAVEHVRRKVKNHSCKVQIMGTDHNGRHYVRLFAKMADMEWMCINDDLVELGYAVFSHQVAEQEKAGSTSPYTTETRSKPSSKSRTLDDFLGEEKEKEEIRQKQRQQYLADYPQSSHSPSLPTFISDENSSDGEMEAIRRQIQSLEGSKGSDNINTTSQPVVTGGGDGIDQNTNLHQKPLVRPGGDSYESDSAVKQRITRLPYQSEAQPNMIGQGSGRSRLGAQRGSPSTDTPQELFGTNVASSMVQSEKSCTSHQLRTGQTFEHSISNPVSGPTDVLSQQVTDSHGKSSTRTSIPNPQSHVPLSGSSLLSTLKKLSPSKSNVVETTSVNSPGEMHPDPSLSTDLESPKSVLSFEADSRKAETHAKPKMPSLLSALKSQTARQQVSGISHAQPSACNSSELSSGSPAVLGRVVEQANGNSAAMVMNKVELVPQQDLTASHNSPVLGAEKETFSTRISPDKVPSNMQRSEPSIMVLSKPPQKPMGRASMLINSLIMVNSPKVGLSVRDMDATVSPDGKRTSLVKVSSSDVHKTVFKQPSCSAVADCETSSQTEKQQEQSEDNLLSPFTQLAEKPDPDGLQPEEQAVMEEQLTKTEEQVSVEDKTESEIPHDLIERRLEIEDEMLNQPGSSDSSSASSRSSRKGKGNISWAEKPIIHTLPDTPLVSQFPSEVYRVYRSVALETVSTETAQDGQSRQAQLSTQSPITQTQVAAQSVGGSGAISKRPTTARLPGVALQKQKKESQSPDILNTPSPPQIPGSSGKPLKSILKKRDSSVYFSDQESSPLNLPGDVVPSPRYSSSDSETLGNPGEQGTPERRILDEDLFSFFHGQHFGSPMLTQQARGLPQKDISEHGVLVDGERPSPPCLSVTDANFDDLVNRGLYDRKFGAPILVQAYIWRPMMRARHVVAVSPPRSGKTLAYLLPVISHILQRDTYKDVPAGNGPLALIVTPSWKKAQQVFDWCYDFLGGRPDAKTLIIYGGGSEEDQYIPLLNGCKILVATPYCLLRMIEKGYTNLNRLCHLVMDDADVLTEDFTDQVCQLMTGYTQVLRTVESSSRPQQIVMVGSQWTPGMASFKDTYMVDPLVIITSKLEASIYAGVKQSVYMCVAAQRDQQLLGILNTFVLQDKKAIIFTNSTRDAIDLSQVLKSQSMYVLVAHKELLSDQLEDIQKDWNIDHREGSKPVLILTDECIKELKLANATCIIHFSLPDTKKAFVNRYGCMLENFKRSQQEEQIVLTSYIIITDQCTEQAQTVLQLLLRTKSYVPKKLQTMVEDVKKAKEEEKSKPLCHYLKSFGVCREPQRCEHRHVVVKEQDTPGISKHHISLPTSGEVKVLVTHVIDSASCFYVRLQELRSETEDSFKAMAAAYVQLVLDMNMWFQVKDNQIIQDEICEGTVCAVQDSQKCYHR